jgi:hypothetical protein
MSRERDTIEALAWAIDLIEMYDQFLVDLGEDPQKVYSETHVSGLAKAKAAWAAAEGDGDR